MSAILFRKSNPLQSVDKKGFIKRDFTSERELKSHMRSYGVINFDLDDFIKNEEEEQQNQLENSNQVNNNQSQSKLNRIKNFVIKNPYLKEIMKETKHFISRKSASLMEYFNFTTMNPFDGKNGQVQNQNEKGEQSQQQQQQNSQSSSQQQSNNKETQSSSSNGDDAQPTYARSDSSIGSNANKLSQNDSLSISSRVQQFIQEQKNQIREKEERRINSLNLSFRSVSHNFNRQSNTSVQSETLQNKKQHKLMENIMMQNSKKVKTSQDEIIHMPLNKSCSIRFQDITNAFENEDIQQDNYDRHHKISKLSSSRKSLSSIVTSNFQNKAGSETNIPDTATIRPTRDRYATYSINRVKEDDENLTQEEREDQQRKQMKLEMEAQKFVQSKLSQKNKVRVQLKRIMEMKQQAKKLNIDYSQYAEQLQEQYQQYKEQKLNKQLQAQSTREKKNDKYQVKLSTHQLKELNRATNSNYSQFLQDPDVVLSRESSYIAYRSNVQQGENSKNSNINLSKQQSQQKHSLFEQESTLPVEQKTKSQSKMKPNKPKSHNNNNNKTFSDSQSICEESISSSPSSSNSLSSSKQPQDKRQQPFDDELSMSSIQRHSDDEDSAIIINMFPNNNSTSMNNNNPLNGNTNQMISSQQSALFKKPQEKKITDEQTSINGITNKITTPKTKEAEQLENNEIQLKPQSNNILSNISTTNQGLFNGELKNDEISKVQDKAENKEQQSGFFANLNDKGSESSNTTAISNGGLFSNIADKPSSKTTLFTETKPETTSLFTNLVAPKTAEGKPAQGSLFGNLTPSTTTSMISTPQTTTENKPTQLFSNLAKPVNTIETKPASTGLFSNLNTSSEQNSSSLFNPVINDDKNTKSLFGSIQETKEVISEAKTVENKSTGLFSNLNNDTNEKKVSSGLFSNLSQQSNDNTNKTPEKKTATTPSLFGGIQIEQKQTIGIVQQEKKENDMEMGSDNVNNSNNNLFGSNSQINGQVQSNNNNVQLLSTPQPNLNGNSSNSQINPFAQANSSPFSQNPFSNSSQQNKPFSLNDLVKGGASYTFQQNENQFQNNNSSQLFQQPANSLFQQQNSGIFNQQQSNNPFQVGQSQSNQFQQPQNNVFQQNNSNPLFNSNLNGNISSFQTNGNMNSEMGMGLDVNNSNFSNFSNQQNNMFGNNNFNNNATPINTFFNQNNNMYGNAPNTLNQSFQPQTNFFGSNNNTINAPANSLFQNTNPNNNAFIGQNNAINSSMSIAPNLFSGQQQQSSLFSGTSQSQNTSNNRKKNASSKIRI